MNEGVKVLIERMKTNPEDFEYVQDKKNPYGGMKEGRFYWVTGQIQSYLMGRNDHLYLTLLKQEDIDALVNAFKEKHEQEFTDKVMRDLFKEEEESVVGPTIAGGWLPQQGLQAKNAVWTDPRIAYLSQQQQAQNQHIRAHMDATTGITSAHTGTGLANGSNGGLLGSISGLFK